MFDLRQTASHQCCYLVPCLFHPASEAMADDVQDVPILPNDLRNPGLIVRWDWDMFDCDFGFRNAKDFSIP